MSDPKLSLSFCTLVDLLRYRSIHQSEDIAFAFLQDGETEETSLTYQELDRRSRAIASYLQALNLSGERALLLYPAGLDFLAAFFGCVYSNVIAVPLYPPKLKRNLGKIQAIATDAQATVVLTTSQHLVNLDQLFAKAPDLKALRWIATDTIADVSDLWQPPVLQGDSLAYLQYTSGSTSTPKGVMISHENVLYNIAYIDKGFEHTADSVAVTWLPHFHDMGLIDGLLKPLYKGIPCYFMPPAAFTQRPIRWLQAISRYKATHSGAPNFAYDFCVRKITPEQRANLDLSSWSVAYNGAEPIDHEVLEKFVEAFASCGFRAEAFCPAYGMAETTLKVCTVSKNDAPIVCTVDKAALEKNQVVEIFSPQVETWGYTNKARLRGLMGNNIRSLVGCGKPDFGTKVVIVNPDSFKQCGENEVGEIWVSGTTVAQGYWNRQEETESTFKATLADTGEGNFLRTGDLGFFHNGELFITGRLKDVIIIRGRNLYPQDIEKTVERSHSALRLSAGAAFAVEVGREEQLVVVQELELRQSGNLEEVIAGIRSAIAAEYEVQPYAVVLIKYGSIPKTTSGKIQRRACKAQFLAGELEIVASSVLENTDYLAAEVSLNREILLATDLNERQTSLEDYLRSQIAKILKVSYVNVDLQQPLSNLGLDSLKLFELKNQIEIDLSVVLSVIELFEDISIAQLATLILGEITTSAPVVSGIKPVNREQELPLSFAQERLWFFDQLEPGNPFYNLAATIDIKGQLNIDALTYSLNEIVKRHEVLRTKFVNHNGKPVQVILNDISWDLSIIDLTSFSAEQRKIEVENLCLKAAQSPFNLQQCGLFRTQILRISETEHILLIAVHHIVFDGWSIRLLLQELAAFYQISTNNLRSLPNLPIQYADFAVWQRQWLQDEVLPNQLKYWQQKLSGNLPVLNLPTDFTRPVVQTFQGNKHIFIIPKNLTANLRKFSKEKKVTLFMLLMAAFKTLLYRYTGQEDILVGSPIANRNHSEIEKLIGFFANTVVFRTNLSSNLTFTNLLLRVRETALAAYQHQDVPFEKLVEVLQPERDLSRNPIFQVLFALHSFSKPELAVAEVNFSLQEIDTRTARFDLALDLWEESEIIRGSLEYNQDLFENATIVRIASHFQTLLESIISDPEQRISTLNLLTEFELKQIGIDYSSTKITSQPLQCIHEIFELQADKSPDAIALRAHSVNAVCEQQKLNYQELNQRANQLAHYLQKLGVKPEVRVGIYVERSLEMIVGMLGILKAGGAYVPLDPSYSNERLQFMLEDAQVNVLLTQAHLHDKINSDQILKVCLDRDWKVISQERHTNCVSEVTPKNLAYVIYTSGSTGKPKGVEITHASVVHLFAATCPTFNFNERDVWTVFHSYAFDFSVWEIWGALLHGSRLVIVPRNLTQSPEEFYNLLVKEQVTILNQTPSALRQLVAAHSELVTGDLNLRLIVCGGEAFPQELAEKILAWNVPVWNFYGPTEATVWATIQQIKGIYSINKVIPIGKAIADKQIYILDSNLQPLPIGIPGEIHIGGIGLARGYLNQVELTAEKFINNPFKPSGKLYKTGDLGRYLPDGTIEFIGRIDYQVKIRGFRIELGEVETVLSQHPAVKQVVVVDQNDELGNKRLVAYIVTKSEQIPNSELRQFLTEKLPEYMVPSAFVILEALPVTANGKIDRKALPAPNFSERELASSFVAPRTPIENLLAEIWRKVLGVTQIGIHDNFFALGGHSLLATQLIAKVREEFQVELPLRSLFQFPTIATLAEQISQPSITTEKAVNLLPTITPDINHKYQPFPLTDIQQAYWVGRSSAFELGNVATHIYVEIDAVELDLERFNLAWQRLIERHDLLRVIILPDGQQQILKEVPTYQVKVLDLQGQSAEGINLQLEKVRDRLDHQILPSDKFPLFEICASQLDQRRTRLHFSFDLLIADAWSFQIIGRELAALYQNPEVELTPLQISFRDYVLAEVNQRNSEQYRRSQEYWRDRIATLAPAPELPLAQNPSAIKHPRFVRHSGKLQADKWQQLKNYASIAGITPSAVLLAAFAEVLTVWSKNPRFTLTLTLFNRLPLHSQVNELVGDFTSISLLEVDNSAEDTFGDRARRLQAQLWEDLDHRDVSGVQILRELARTQGRLSSALMPVVFTSTLTQEALGEQKFPLDWLGEMTYGITQTPQVFLDHQVAEEAGALVFNWDAVEAIFPTGMLDDMFAAYCNFLESLAQREENWQEIHPRLIPQTQLNQFAAINATDAAISSDLLHTLFTAQVDLQAEKVAVVTSDRTLTYAELYRLANQLGHKLRDLGAKPNQLVAVVMEKGWEQVVAVLGILMSGAAYVPIDPKLPQERRSHLFKQAEIQLVVTQPCVDKRLYWSEGIQRICVDIPDAETRSIASTLEPVQKPEDIAYVIYTSGSTGLPKGVTIDHRGAVNTILDINHRFNVQASDKVFALSALNFDLSVYDIFGTLAAGSAIVIPDASATQEPSHWAELMQREQITIWNSVPALMQMMVDYGCNNSAIFQHLRLVMLSGDWLPLNLPNQIKALNSETEVISLGGATEASIWSIYYPIESVNPYWKSIPYGKPLQNQHFYVLNHALEPCPILVPGQLYIGGIGLAKCYWRDEAKTSASFITHPRTGERLYKTGDLGRYLPDGNIEFLGREDFQVKIGGYRIELGEIESALLKHPAVREAVVNAVGEKPTHKRLVAYIIPTEETPQIEELRSFLSEKLPAYMIPSAFVMLESLPLTANGKVNRQALPIPSAIQEIDSTVVAPRNSTETTLAKLWFEVLGVENISIYDNFFDLGGDSILVTQLITKVREVFQVELPLRDFFEQPTIAAFVECLEKAKNSGSKPEESEIVPISRKAYRMKLSSL
ncbi:amino acid adenylation domain protein [Crinalium epipsammum PCC 9333]|uniref:Phenyloxazoline synthase MbtB n=1 Tax=Crinalium epipsammum PCC 9333 TaxID=1173022 RepID=K9VVQ3_9CYAN|nr:non-ribosomal peptide synthetase [Crinalium epipsammum]AFZ11265.1 amino acid adenylation domain protein [Crinalium epipsammum PCC 9333]